MFFLRQNFSIKIIKNYGPMHFIFYIPIIFLFQKTIMIVFTKLHYKEFFITSNKIKIEKYFLDISGDIFSLFGFLIHLEKFHITICNFNYFIRPSDDSRLPVS